jgi:RIO-like serine/threonine protein kinase
MQSPLVELPFPPGVPFRLGISSYKVLQEFKNDFFAQTLLLTDLKEQKKYVLKISRIKTPSLRPFFQFLLNWLGKREAKIYYYLQGTTGIPRLIDAYSNWFIHEYIEGENLKNFRQVSDTFFDELLQIFHTIHQKGIVYVDSAKKDNILVGSDQKPYLIDFQISLFFRTKKRKPTKIHKIFIQEDLYHIYKHKRSIRSDLINEEERKIWEKESKIHALHNYFLVKPFHWFKRKYLPSYF